MHLITVVGARPQFIKAAAVSRAIRERGDIVESLVHTGQHFDDDMSQVFFDELGIPHPKHHLGVRATTHGAMTGRMLEAIEAVLLTEQPEAVIVYGDTNSTLAGALAAAKLHIPVAHVEAGLRSFNRRMPEELNRVATDHLSTLLLAPTQVAVANLEGEGIGGARVRLVGDVMYDIAVEFGSRDAAPAMADHGLTPGRYVLATVHRAENTDDLDRLVTIFEGLRLVARELPVVMPLHPRTRAALERAGLLASVASELHLTDPVGYVTMAALERNAAVIATDSGGMQKEAYFHRVPCVTLRDETEWTELVEHGWNRLVPPTSAARVAASVLSARGTLGGDVELYGGGSAAQAVVDAIASHDWS